MQLRVPADDVPCDGFGRCEDISISCSTKALYEQTVVLHNMLDLLVHGSWPHNINSTNYEPRVLVAGKDPRKVDPAGSIMLYFVYSMRMMR